MRRFSFKLAALLGLAALSGLAACDQCNMMNNDDELDKEASDAVKPPNLVCGPGTRLSGNTCVPTN